MQALFCFLRSLGFARIRLCPLGGEVLHHDSVSMIVSRNTAFTGNFVIRSYEQEHFSSTRFSVNSSDHSGRSSDGIPRTFSLSPFFVFFHFCWFMRRAFLPILCCSYSHFLLMLDVAWKSQYPAMKMLEK